MLSTSRREPCSRGSRLRVLPLQFGICGGQGKEGDINGAFERIEDAKLRTGKELLRREAPRALSFRLQHASDEITLVEMVVTSVQRAQV
jgi:hypothetical protein